MATSLDTLAMRAVAALPQKLASRLLFDVVGGRCAMWVDCSARRSLCGRAGLGAVISAVLAGCTSTAIHHASSSYYVEGPEKTLQVLETGQIRDEDQMLVSMEQAVALQELGAYEESNVALAEGIRQLESSPPDPVGFLINDEAGSYRGEYFERVYMHTLAVSNFLALQEVELAAEEAERALSTIEAVPCTRCRYPFTRYLAALSFEAAGDADRALDTLTEAIAESPNLGFLRTELQRISYESASPSAPESTSGRGRVLYVVLLLGRGPQKVEAAVPVPPSHTVAWPEYVSRGPQMVGAVELVAATDHHRSVVLTDVEQLARASLNDRKTGLIAGEFVKTVAQEVIVRELGEEVAPGAEWLGRLLFSMADRADLRHWSTLPATCQVLRVPLPEELGTCDLEYVGPDGSVVDRETIELPASWTEGPLYITRRMP
jgi:hypothetical protein